MATSKGHIARPSYRFLPTMDRDPISDSAFEFDESDLYYSARANSPEFRKTVHGASRLAKKSSSSGDRPASLPVNVPDWSKILGEEYRKNRRRDAMDDDDEGESDDGYEAAEEGGGRVVPPHEFLAKTRIASFSVHEGIGRTLKGRDLSRVRNAIWAKTGFED